METLKGAREGIVGTIRCTRVRGRARCVSSGDCVALKKEELPFLIPVKGLTVVVFVFCDLDADW